MPNYLSVNTHLNSVHASVSSSAAKLNHHFRNTIIFNKVDIVKREIQAFLNANAQYFSQDKNHPHKAQRILLAINYLLPQPLSVPFFKQQITSFKDPNSGVTLRNLLLMAWLSLSKPNSLLIDPTNADDYKKRLLDNIYEGATEYVANYNFYGANYNFYAAKTCDPGWFNKITYSLEGSLSCVEITIQTKENLSAAISHHLNKFIKDFIDQYTRYDTQFEIFSKDLLEAQGVFANIMRSLIQEYYTIFKFTSRPNNDTLNNLYPDNKLSVVYNEFLGCSDFSQVLELFDVEDIFKAKKSKLQQASIIENLKAIANRVYIKSKASMLLGREDSVADILKLGALELEHRHFEKFINPSSEPDDITYIDNLQYAYTSYIKYGAQPSVVSTGKSFFGSFMISEHISAIVDKSVNDCAGLQAACLALGHLISDPAFTNMSARIKKLNFNNTQLPCLADACYILEIKQGLNKIYCDPLSRVYSVNNLDELKIQFTQEASAQAKQERDLVLQHTNKLLFSKQFAAKPVVMAEGDDLFAKNSHTVFRMYDDFATPTKEVCVDEQHKQILMKIQSEFNQTVIAHEKILSSKEETNKFIQSKQTEYSVFDTELDFKPEDKEQLQIMYNFLYAFQLWSLYPNNPHAFANFEKYHATFLNTFDFTLPEHDKIMQVIDDNGQRLKISA